jgi:hypothetical protein
LNDIKFIENAKILKKLESSIQKLTYLYNTWIFNNFYDSLTLLLVSKELILAIKWSTKHIWIKKQSKPTNLVLNIDRLRYLK